MNNCQHHLKVVTNTFRHKHQCSLQIPEIYFSKLGCVLQMVILSEFRMEQNKDNEYRENAPYFSFEENADVSFLT